MLKFTKLINLFAISLLLFSSIAKSEDATMDIVDTAVNAGTFNTLALALTEAGLVDTLKGTGPFTVFAPNDAAFEALPEGTLDSLLANKTELIKVLTHHVVSGQILSSDLVTNMVGNVTSLNGTKLYYAATAEAVKVEDANVISADIMATNGVIHVIDKVLIPPTDCNASFNSINRSLTIPCIMVNDDSNTYQAVLHEIPNTDLNFETTSVSVKSE